MSLIRSIAAAGIVHYCDHFLNKVGDKYKTYTNIFKIGLLPCSLYFCYRYNNDDLFLSVGYATVGNYGLNLLAYGWRKISEYTAQSVINPLDYGD